MTDFKELARIRRSRRQYTEEQVTEEELKTVLRAALMAPSAKSLRQWNFTYTRDKVKIQALSEVREHGSGFLANAPVAIAVSGPAEEQDTWIEDCSLAAVSMQYQAQDLGLGTCWCQIRGRESRTEGVSADSVVKDILGIDPSMSVLCILALGHPSDERGPKEEESLKWSQVRDAD